MRTRLHRSRRTEPAELNITAFMNLMVALVPFLLVMAVFSRMAVLELRVPAADSAATEEPPLQLEVVARKDKLIVRDLGKGMMRELPNQGDGYDLASLSNVLQQLKSKSPDTVEATLLLEPHLIYEQIVQLMDTVRVAPVQQNGRTIQAELFPEISIGDAPVATRRG